MSMKKIYCQILAVFFCTAAWAQTDNLMFVEYVDWTTGSGLGLTIYNPTDQSINLNSYSVRVHNNGNLNPNSMGDLSGSLPAGASIRVGNSAYAVECPGSIVISIAGVNDQDVVTLAQNDVVIDAIGALGYTGNYQINGTVITQSLKWVKLIRNADNCTRYTESDGGSKSWPISAGVNFTGWTVAPVSCLNPSINFEISSPQLATESTICFGDSVLFAGEWRSEAGEYSATVPVNGGCDSLLILDLTVNASQTEFDQATLCFGDSLFLAGSWQTQSGTYTDTLSAGEGCPQVLQTMVEIVSADTVNVAQTICPGESFSFADTTITDTGIYFVNFTEPGNACSQLYRLFIEVEPFSYTSMTLTSCDSILVNGVYYTETTTVYDSLLSENGCLTQISEYLVRIEIPQLNIVGPNGICPDEPAFLEAIATSEPVWSTGETGYSMVATPNVGTWYSARLQFDGCFATDSIFIEVSDLSVNMPDTVEIEFGATIQPGVIFTGSPYIFAWTPEAGVDLDEPYDPAFSPETSTVYTLLAEDIYGCTVTDSIFIEVILPEFHIPNIITPNGDGRNDFLVIQDLPATNTLRIFNRWGQEVLFAAPYQNDWAANINGSEPVEGHFNYILHVQLGPERLEYTGVISVVGVHK